MACHEDPIHDPSNCFGDTCFCSVIFSIARQRSPEEDLRPPAEEGLLLQAGSEYLHLLPPEDKDPPPVEQEECLLYRRLSARRLSRIPEEG